MLTGQRILLTGLTGQVGGSLVGRLAARNQVYGLARYTAAGSRETVEALGVTPVVCDYTSGDFTGVPDDVDYVIHVAADTDPATLDEGIRQNAEGTGLLLHHCSKAKGWFYTSTTGVYWDHPDPYYAYKETDRCGGSTRVTARFHYGTSKLTGEAVARAMSRVHQVPLVIARLNWSYGQAGDGGLPGMLAEAMLAGHPIGVHDWPFLGSPIHEDDLAASIGPFLAAATIGGTIVNWAGDDAITNVELANHIGELIGVTPTFVKATEARAYPRVTDNTRRLQIYGPCKVAWRDGIRRMLAERHPEIQLREASPRG